MEFERVARNNRASSGQSKEIALNQLTVEGKFQRELSGKILDLLYSNENADSLIATFDPSRIPLELDPYYCLEIAIKVGNLEAVHSLFSRFEEKRPFFKEEMRSSIYMEVPYRPIFWLSLVCDSRKVPFGAPPCETYIKISQFLEEKLEIKSDYFHQTPKGNISKWEYVEKFCNDPIKKNLLDFFRN